MHLYIKKIFCSRITRIQNNCYLYFRFFFYNYLNYLVALIKVSVITSCLLGFMLFCRLLIFSKSTFFWKILQKCHQRVKQFIFRSDPKVCFGWSGSKLFAKMFSNQHHIAFLITTFFENFFVNTRPLVKRVHQKIKFLISKPKHMFWVLKRIVSLWRFFWEPKTYVKTDG